MDSIDKISTKGYIVKRRKAFIKEERLVQIIAVFTSIIPTDDHELTTADVAKKLDITPSPHLRELLNGLIKQGVLVVRKEDYAGICQYRRLYRLNPEYVIYTPKGTKKTGSGRGRTIAINTRQGHFLEVLHD